MKILAAIFLALLMSLNPSAATELSMEGAVKLAENFIAENGYTNMPLASVKATLDNESLEWTFVRSERLVQRSNTLKSKAIGARKTRVGKRYEWNIAFDFVGPSDPACRVVTMNLDGTDIHVEHKDGVRKYFLGFHWK
jgi:hypothetical protein